MNENETNAISKMSVKVIGGGVYLKNKPQTITITWEIKDENGNIITPDTLSVNNIPLDPTTTSKTYHRVFSDVDFTVRAVKDGVLAIGTTTARFVGPTQTVEDSLISNSRSIAASANSVRLLNEKIENNNSFKGLFTSLDDLKKKLRSGNNGDWAIVGEGIPAPIYIWNKNGWEATGGQYTGSTIDLDNYYTKEGVADYTDDYNVSKNHSHIVKIYDLVNWKVVERKPEAPVFQLGQSYDAGEVVNMTDDNDSSYECLQATITAPYLSQEVRSFTLAEAISFLPEDLRVTGQKISFLSSELNAWMTYVFTGGDYTNPTYWEIFTNNIDPDTNQKIADLQAKDEDLQNQINEDVTNLNNHIAESDAKFEEIDNTLTEHEDRMDDIEDEILLSSVEAACAPKDVEILADRAYKDHLGNIIADEYITRDTLTEEIIDITNQQVTDLKPGSVQPEDLSEAVKQMIGCKKITNLPDEEDITVTEDNTLKFKDREYSPKDYSGMGKKILRKHYIDGINTLTQHMINKPNTIYVIRYDYCLQGQTIEIPENCVLEFDGGSLRNGTVICANTSINASSKIFEENLILQNYSDRIFAIWYGIKENTDCTEKINRLAKSGLTVLFPDGTFNINTTIELTVNTIFIGTGKFHTTFNYTGEGDCFRLQPRSGLNDVGIIIPNQEGSIGINIDTSTWEDNIKNSPWGINTKIEHVYITVDNAWGNELHSIGINILVKRKEGSSIERAISYLPYFNDIYINLVKTGIKMYHDGVNGSVWANEIHMNNLVLNADLGLDIDKNDSYTYNSTGKYCFNTVLYQSLWNNIGVEGKGIKLHGLSIWLDSFTIWDTPNSGELTSGAKLIAQTISLSAGGYANYGFTVDDSSELYVNTTDCQSGYTKIRRNEFGQGKDGVWRDSYAFVDFRDTDKTIEHKLGLPVFDDFVRPRHGYIYKNNKNSSYTKDTLLEGRTVCRSLIHYEGKENYVKFGNHWRTAECFYERSTSHSNKNTQFGNNIYYSVLIQEETYDVFNVYVYLEGLNTTSNCVFEIPFSIQLASEPSDKVRARITNCAIYPLQWTKNGYGNCNLSVKTWDLAKSSSDPTQYKGTFVVYNNSSYQASFNDCRLYLQFLLYKTYSDRDSTTTYPDGTNTYDRIPDIDPDFYDHRPKDFILDFENIITRNIIVVNNEDESLLGNRSEGSYTIIDQYKKPSYYYNKEWIDSNGYKIGENNSDGTLVSRVTII